MSQALLNLSTRPYVNLRPVVRLSLVLWAVGLLLLAGNLWLYWDFLAGRGDLEARRRAAGEAIRVEQRRIEALSSELAGFDLGAQNEQVIYLNQRIQQRRFSWSRLFDELADLLPEEVRLTRLQPSAAESSTGRSGRAGGRALVAESAVGEGPVLLAIEGRARTDRAILELVDALFTDPDFERPNLLQQAQEEGGAIRFDLDVYYRPQAAGEPELLALDGEEEGGESLGGGLGGARSEPGRSRPPVALGRAASAPRELR